MMDKLVDAQTMHNSLVLFLTSALPDTIFKHLLQGYMYNDLPKHGFRFGQNKARQILKES